MYTEDYTPIEKKLFARMAKSSKEFVVILGAGASRPAGLPGWEGLRESLLDRLIDYYKIIGCNDDEIKKEVDVINSKIDLWDSFSILRQKLDSSDYEDTVKELLSTKGKNIPELYKLIWGKCPRLRGNWSDVELLQIDPDSAKLRSFDTRGA